TSHSTNPTATSNPIKINEGIIDVLYFWEDKVTSKRVKKQCLLWFFEISFNALLRAPHSTPLGRRDHCFEFISSPSGFERE
ncbi:MAG: hypothetical protein II786_04200, partial [Muribaculaceae bacterium]|nr:hypothetical protein [Muribaculaceae bacterium]